MTVSHPCSITVPQMLSREADAHGTGCLALSLKWEEPKTWGLKWKKPSARSLGYTG